ncbi:MAG: PDZ domain-containing protein [Deltaproteobacteria bacterium]
MKSSDHISPAEKLLLIVLVIILTIRTNPCLAYNNDLIIPNKKIEIPFTYNNGLIQLKVKLNGIPLSFIYDTGAEHSILTNKEVAVLLNLRIVKEIDVFGADLLKRLTAYVTEPLHIELFETRIIKERVTDEKKIKFVEEVEVRTEQIDFFSKFEPILILERDIFNESMFSSTISGIIGASFFSNMTVEIDYRHQVLKLYPYGVKPKLKGFSELPVVFTGNKPILSVRMKINEDDDTLSANLLIDTGCSIPILMLENIDSKFHLPDKTVNGQIGMGLGGDLTGWIGLTSHLKLDQYAFHNLLTKFQDTDSINLTKSTRVRDGLLGNEILNRFTIIIDNINKKVYIKPNKDLFQPFKYDKSGLTLFASGKNLDQFYIKHVIPGSPADIAGIRPEDRIVRFQNFSYRFWSIQGIVEKLRGKDNKEINIRVLRAGNKIDFKFRLKDMFR